MTGLSDRDVDEPPKRRAGNALEASLRQLRYNLRKESLYWIREAIRASRRGMAEYTRMGSFAQVTLAMMGWYRCVEASTMAVERVGSRCGTQEGLDLPHRNGKLTLLSVCPRPRSWGNERSIQAKGFGLNKGQRLFVRTSHAPDISLLHVTYTETECSVRI